VRVSEAEDGGVFVSYRRQETSGVAGRLADQLAERFGRDRIFIDVDAIEPGVDFAEAIVRAVETCGVLLAVIGPGWLTAMDDQGRPRLEDPDDIVRIEIEAALARNVRVIPILVENAVMPRRHDLPESLGGLARRNAFAVRHESFRADADRLIKSIEGIIGALSREQLNKIIQSKSRGEERDAEQEKWRLELLADVGARKVFRLASGREVHEIIIALNKWKSDAIYVDGERVARQYDIGGKIFFLNTLSSKLDSDVNIRVSRGGDNLNEVKSLVIRVGDQVLTFPEIGSGD
jgi:hypothetical protein